MQRLWGNQVRVAGDNETRRVNLIHGVTIRVSLTVHSSYVWITNV